MPTNRFPGVSDIGGIVKSGGLSFARWHSDRGASGKDVHSLLADRYSDATHETIDGALDVLAHSANVEDPPVVYGTGEEGYEYTVEWEAEWQGQMPWSFTSVIPSTEPLSAEDVWAIIQDIGAEMDIGDSPNAPGGTPTFAVVGIYGIHYGS